MENYENCVNSQKIKHSTVPHWTSGSSKVFKRLISNKKSRSIVMSEEVNSSNLKNNKNIKFSAHDAFLE
jgi:hypothetical protein